MFSGQNSNYFGCKVIADATRAPIEGKNVFNVRFVYNPLGDKYEPQFVDASFNVDMGGFKQAAELKKGATISVTGQLQIQAGKDGKTYLKIPYPNMLVVHDDTRSASNQTSPAPATAPAAAKTVTRRAVASSKKAAPAEVEDTSDIPF